jgi:hypothetical protein
MIYVKVIKFGTKISLFETRFLPFFAEATEKIRFSTTLCISKSEYEDIYIYIFFPKFYNFLKYILDKGSIYT